ncbi:MAG: T9SS type A sorting domain-containing protein [Bacteroidales bacterium]|nr:T9SS type A sorting domain-containing protein [Bacteroidales bacterium]
MKKFYMILAALLIGSVCFAQKTMSISNNPMINGNSVNEKATGWYGNGTPATYFDYEAGEYLIMRPETFAGATTAGEQVTKVKFYNYQDADEYPAYTSMSFTIKIYEGSAMNEDLINDGYVASSDDNATVLGTLVRTQDFTATSYGEQTVELNEPYTITNANYWVVLQCNGKSLLVGNKGAQISGEVTATQLQNDEYPDMTISDFSDAQYLIYNTDSYLDIDAYYMFFYTTQPNVAAFWVLPYFQIYVQGSGEYVPTSDFEVKFFGGISGNQLTAAQASYTLTSATDELSLLPFFANNGNDDAVSGTVTFDLTIDGISLMNGGSAMTLGDDTIPVGGWYNLLPSPYAYTMTAQEMIDAGLSGTFDVCLTVSYTGNDPDLTNNSHCIPVTLAVTSVEENLAEEVSVYPNPANDMFTVANAEGATIVVVNSLGQVVANIENAAANQTIDASNFANGTYFVKVNESVVKINVVK